MAAEVSEKSGKSNKPLTQEQIIGGFNMLRQEQRQMATKIAELETEQNEHKAVVETLKEVDGDRRCFRLIGGVLVERTVKEILPALELNRQKIGELIETVNEQLVKKAKEINDYREKYNIKIRSELPAEEDQEKKDKPVSQGVLVGKDS
ncbi:prefoldin subunit 2-like [Ptychodera flava]|uniref:prefoldin subunit 2-like n=1 Tax=Ptychodera flava TaxID=63121 RepID=UPI00396A22F2